MKFRYLKILLVALGLVLVSQGCFLVLHPLIPTAAIITVTIGTGTPHSRSPISQWFIGLLKSMGIQRNA